MENIHISFSRSDVSINDNINQLRKKFNQSHFFVVLIVNNQIRKASLRTHPVSAVRTKPCSIRDTTATMMTVTARGTRLTRGGVV